jgi:predicted transcriptional regulator
LFLCFGRGAVRPICYTGVMTAKVLKEVLERVETWPEEAQEELAEIAREIDAGLKGVRYSATSEELAGIDRGLKAAGEGRFATDEELEAIRAKHRRS